MKLRLFKVKVERQSKSRPSGYFQFDNKMKAKKKRDSLIKSGRVANVCRGSDHHLGETF